MWLRELHFEVAADEELACHICGICVIWLVGDQICSTGRQGLSSMSSCQWANVKVIQKEMKGPKKCWRGRRGAFWVQQSDVTRKKCVHS